MSDWVSIHTGFDSVLQGKLVSSGFAALLLWLLYHLLCTFIRRRSTNTRIEYELRKAAQLFIVFVGIFLIGRVWFRGLSSLTTIIGLASAGLAIALKDPITNLFGRFYILWQKPFRVGDRIEIAENHGDVVDQGLLQFTIMEIRNWVSGDQSTGRMVHIPNGLLFQKPLGNYSAGYPYLWDELHIRLTFESNWKTAKDIVERVLKTNCETMSKEAEQALQKASHTFMIISDNREFAQHIFTKVLEFGVMIDARYIVEYRHRRGMQAKIWEDILTEFAKHDDITFAYPTWRISGTAHGSRGTTDPQVI